MKILLLTLLGLAIFVSAKKVTYENFKVYDVVPETEEQVQILKKLREQEGYDFWSRVINVGSKVRFMVYPQIDSDFVDLSRKFGLNAVVSISNLQELMDAQMIPAKNVSRNSHGSFSWDRYRTLDDIYAWLDELTETYPTLVKTIVIGSSNEGRQIKGVIIDFKQGERDQPLIGMIEGGIHAREWISPATATWIIKEFLTSNDPGVQFVAETFVWHIFPVINPDGYAYTFTDDRMWRKNRNFNHSTNCTLNDDLSNGIDLNRNFDFVWASAGGSPDPCCETFAGPSGASEPETRAISNYVLTLQQQGSLLYYFSLHSWYQMILVPFSHLIDEDKLQAGNFGDMFEVAIRAADKLTAVHGTPYIVGASRDILDAHFSGSSFDWAKGVGNVPFSYLIELRDDGEYGFLLPPEQIVPNNEEVMALIVEADRVTRQLGYYSSSAKMILNSSFLILIAMFSVLVFNR